ncbi:MAG: heterodisulfide reductase-related iron-sulfur binding cluster [bacterium]|nr:heterodisulfide reductase-related iron-sulfur binding cluster [bacterium]
MLENTREIYWNIPASSVPLMYLMAALGTGVMLWGFARRLKVYKQGRSLARLNGLGRRLFLGLSEALFQGKVGREKGIGALHNFFFWGFLVLFIGTTLIFIQTDILEPLAGITFLKGDFYKTFSLAMDLGGLVALIMMAGMFTRRYLLRPKGLLPETGDGWMYLNLFTILLTGFLLEGLRMAVTEVGLNEALAIYSPVGLIFARWFALLDEGTIRSLHLGLWWFHLVLVTAFLAMIPFTRLKHLFLTPINYLFFDDHPKGHLVTLDLEDESAESFGLGKPSDLTWKDIFDTDACTSCKRCQDRCPAYNTDKPLSPMKLIQDMGKVCFEMKDGSLSEAVGKEAIWACTTCRACMETCPADIEHVPKIIGMRRNLALMEGEFPGDEVAKAMDSFEVNYNPLGSAPAARADWAEGLPLVPIEEADYLYFVGCYASFDARNQKVAKAFVKLAHTAGVKLAILGKGERCCGEPARKMGNEYLYQTLAGENIESLQKVQKVVTTCPHCFQTLNRDYRDLGFTGEVIHYTALAEQWWKDFRFKLDRSPGKVTYHDSCYLGRYNGLYGEPRGLLEATGRDLSEMTASGPESFCCGAGGGRILAEENLGTRISVQRAQMAQKTGAEVVVSSCPFCLTMMEDAVKGLDGGQEMVAMDLLELLAQGLPESNLKES